MLKLQARWLSCVSPALVLAACGLGTSSAAESPPDLSGVWTWHIEPGKSPFAPPGSVMSLPFTPEGRKKVEEYRALVGPTSDNPGAHCLGSGMPESMTFSGGYPMEIIQRPEQITVIYEAHSEIRRLYFGAKIIPEGDRVPSRNGYSTARWEGSTLVVETSNLKEQEDQGYPHSEQAHITERYHLTTQPNGARVLVAEWTLTDPVFYTKPVSAEKKWTFDPKGILLPYECNEEAWLDRLEALKKQHNGETAAAAKY
jgi:hypothetical protein